MTERLVDSNDELLQLATAVLGAKTTPEPVNRALESVVLADRRRRHAARLVSSKGLDLGDAEVMAGAWR